MNCDSRAHCLVKLRLIDVNVDDLRVGCIEGRIAGDAVVKAHADCHYHVGAVSVDVGPEVAVHAEHALHQRMVRGQSRQTEQRRADRDRRFFGEPPQTVAGARDDDALTGDQHRPPGGIDHLSRLLKRLSVDGRSGVVAAYEVDRIVMPAECADLRVLGDVEHHRTGPSCRSDIERTCDGRRNVLGPAHLIGPLGYRLRDADYIGLLKGIAAEILLADLSGDDDKRRRVGHRVAKTRNHVGGAGARGHDHPSRPAADARKALGGMDCTLLVTHENMPQTVGIVIQFVVNRKDRAARIAENGLRTGFEQRTHKRFGYIERLFAVIGLCYQQVIYIHTQFFGIETVESVLCINKRRYAARFLRLGYGVYGKRGLTGRLGTEYLYYTALGIALYTERGIERDGTGRDNRHILHHLVAHTHNGTLTVIFLYLLHCRSENFQLLGGGIVNLFFRYFFSHIVICMNPLSE